MAPFTFTSPTLGASRSGSLSPLQYDEHETMLENATLTRDSGRLSD